MRSLIVHGGAWDIADAEVDDHLRGVRAALDRGWTLLAAGAAAIDVVTETIAVMEDDPAFDAGLGSVLNRDGRISMDASIIEGEAMRAGCCIGVSEIKNPIRLARGILDDGRAVMLSGEGAHRFGREAGIETCRMEDLIVEREIRRKAFLDELESYKTRQPFDGTLPHPQGTVGAVCCDGDGRLAAATSTGGAPNTIAGRVGDCPILGAGAWAERGSGAASATGWGEAILRDLLAFRAVQEIDTVTIGGARPGPAPIEASPIPPQPITWGPLPRGVSRTPEAWAARRAIQAFARRVNGVGGVILLGSDGNPGFAFNTPRMARGFRIEGMGEPAVEIEPAYRRNEE